MRKYSVRNLNIFIFICLCIHLLMYPITNLQAAPKDEKMVKIGEIVSLQRDSKDKPNGAIYGQAQMDYVFTLTKASKSIQMGRGGHSGIGYMNTPQGSVYCMDPERFACANVGEGVNDQYRVEDYQEENAERIGLIWYYGNAKHANVANYMDYVAVTQIMIWEELGWSASIQDGFQDYVGMRDEIETKIREHKKTLQWEVVETNVEDPNHQFILSNEHLDLQLEAGKYVILKDKSGNFNRYFAHWDSIPSGVKVERVEANSIKLTALSGYTNDATIKYSEVEPEMIGHAYLLKPNGAAGAGDCQTLIMPYVNESVSNTLEFRVRSDGSGTDKEEIAITYPKLMKIDEESRFPLEGAQFAISAAEPIQAQFEVEKEVCHTDSEGNETCDSFISTRTSTIFTSGKVITQIMSDEMGLVDLTCLGELYEEQATRVSDKILNEDHVVSVDLLTSFPGGKFAYQEIKTMGNKNTYAGYYNQNRNKKVTFVMDQNSGERTIVEKNKRQKGKIVFRKVDGDDFYLNHHIQEIPQGDGSFEHAVFNLYARNDIALPNGQVVYRAGDFIEEITTDEEGIGESSLLELGQYFIQEVQLPEGYWYYNYNTEGQEVDIDIRYSTQDVSVRVFTFDEDERGTLSPFEEIEIVVQKSENLNQSLAYRNSIQKGHVEFTKHYEGPIDDREGEVANKLPVEDVYFGIYLNSKRMNAYQTNLPDEYFMSKQLDGTKAINRTFSVSNEPVYDNVHKRSLYMVLKTNEKGYASTRDPKSIVWANLAKNDAENTMNFTQEIPLPYGEYTVEELNTPQGYVPSSFQLKIDRVSEELSKTRANQFEYVFANKIIQNHRALQNVVISKRDSESDALIQVDEATFKIWKWNVHEIIDPSQITTVYDEDKQDWIVGIRTSKIVPNETGNGGREEVMIDTTKGKWIHQIESTTSGIHYLDRYQTIQGQLQLPQPLMVGDYLLCEIKAPSGYALSYVPLTFTVKDILQSQDIDDNQFIEVAMLDELGEVMVDDEGNVLYCYVPNRITIHVDELNDPQKGMILLRKEGQVFDKFVKQKGSLGLDVYKPIWTIDALANGAIFEVYADGDIYVNQQRVYQNHERVDRLRIDVHGQAKSVPLPLGTYYIKEAESKAGYLTNDEVIDVKLDAQHQRQIIFPKFLSTVNERKKPTIQFDKLFNTRYGLQSANLVYFGLYSNEYLSTTQEVEYEDEIHEESDINLFSYEFIDDKDESKGIRITGFKDEPIEKVWLPSNVNGNLVKEVGTKAFYDQGIKSLVIPSSIEKMGSSAFEKNQLTRVEFKINSKLRFEDDTIFNQNQNLIHLIVDQIQYLDTVQIGYQMLSPFDVKDGRCLGYKLIRKESNSIVQQDSINFELKKDGESINSDLQDESDFVYVDTLIEVIEVKDGKGYVESELIDGKYYLKEMSAPSQYVISDKKYEFEYDEGKPIVINAGLPIINHSRDDFTEIPSIPFDDQVSIQILKIFENADKHDTWAIFSLFNEKDEKIGDIQITKNQEILSNFSLKPGRYYVKETSCSDDYVLNLSRYDFVIEKNTRNIVISPDREIVNLLKRLNLELHKIDKDSQKPLIGAEFALYDQDLNMLWKKSTDIDGNLTFENIECGTFFLKEVQAPENYVRDEKLYPIEIKGKDFDTFQTMKLTFTNDSNLTVDYPETGRIIQHKLSLELAIIAFGIYVLALFLKKES